MGAEGLGWVNRAEPELRPRPLPTKLRLPPQVRSQRIQRCGPLAFNSDSHLPGCWLLEGETVTSLVPWGLGTTSDSNFFWPKTGITYITHRSPSVSFLATQDHSLLRLLQGNGQTDGAVGA